MVPGEEYLGDGHPLERPGPGVLGVAEPGPGVERVRSHRLVAAHHPGDHPCCGLHDHRCSKLPAGEDEVPDRKLKVAEGGHPLVHPLVAAAEEGHRRPAGEVLGHPLGEEDPLGGGEDRVRPAAELPLDRRKRPEERLRPKDHPRPAPEPHFGGETF